jgi:hypothetical protein
MLAGRPRNRFTLEDKDWIESVVVDFKKLPKLLNSNNVDPHGDLVGCCTHIIFYHKLVFCFSGPSQSRFLNYILRTVTITVRQSITHTVSYCSVCTVYLYKPENPSTVALYSPSTVLPKEEPRCLKSDR